MSYGKFTEYSAIACNTYYKREIDAQTLVNILAGKTPPDEWKPHLGRFFGELPQKYILGVMEENNLSLEQLTKIFETIPAVFRGKKFKELIQHG